VKDQIQAEDQCIGEVVEEEPAWTDDWDDDDDGNGNADSGGADNSGGGGGGGGSSDDEGGDGIGDSDGGDDADFSGEDEYPEDEYVEEEEECGEECEELTEEEYVRRDILEADHAALSRYWYTIQAGTANEGAGGGGGGDGGDGGGGSGDSGGSDGALAESDGAACAAGSDAPHYQLAVGSDAQLDASGDHSITINACADAVGSVADQQSRPAAALAAVAALGKDLSPLAAAAYALGFIAGAQ